jgi:hypothetical protein
MDCLNFYENIFSRITSVLSPCYQLELPSIREKRVGGEGGRIAPRLKKEVSTSLFLTYR